MRSIVITGPTASGKTGKAVAVAKAFSGEIISADSRQVYTGMDIGSGKDLEEYDGIPYHLIDIVPAGEKYNLHRYIIDFRKAYADVTVREKLPVICGGSGMYLENALSGISLPDVPENRELRESLKNLSLEELTEILRKKKRLHNITDVDNCRRAIRAIEIQEYCENHPEEANVASRENVTPVNALIIGIDIPREERRRRISERLEARLEAGMVQEVERLLKSGIPVENLIYYGLEYKFLTLYLTGKLRYDEMKSELEIAIHQFAKRQMTWFRGMERRGFHLRWLPYDMSDTEFVDAVGKLLGKY